MISIIIPTYQRPVYISRALAYWSIYPVKVIVVDGSIQPSVTNELICSYENVEYFHLPIAIERRLMFATEKIRTQYAAILSDDEFFSYSALMAAANILKSEPEVSAVLGATIGFDLCDKRFVARQHYRSAQHLDISSDSPRTRLLQRASVPENSIFYPLVRASVLKLAGSFLGDHQYSCPYIAEYQMEAVLCAAGRIKVMQKLMWFRNLENNIISNSSYNRSIFFSPWCNDPENAVCLQRLKDSATRYLGLASSLSSSPPITCFEFIETYSQDPGQFSPNVKGRRGISAIRNYYVRLPFRFRSLIRSAIKLFSAPQGGKLFPVEVVLNELTLQGIDFDADEVSRVADLVEARDA